MEPDIDEIAPHAEVIDMTELAAAMAVLNGEAPPSGRVTVAASTLAPISTRMREEAAATEAEAIAEAARKMGNAKPGDRMSDGTFYLGCFRGADGKEMNWFAAAMDANDEGTRLSLDFNEAAAHAKTSTAHGYSDWIVPPGPDDSNGEPDILNEIFNNKAKVIGLDNTGFYWSSSSGYTNDNYAKIQRFDGYQYCNVKSVKHFVRLVRSVAVKEKHNGP